MRVPLGQLCTRSRMAQGSGTLLRDKRLLLFRYHIEITHVKKPPNTRVFFCNVIHVKSDSAPMIPLP